jgi:hypothetical protein
VDQYLPGSAPGQSSSAPPSSQSTATPHAVLGAVKFPSLKTVIARGVRVRLTCAAKCRTTVQLRLASRTARRMHLQVVVGSKTVSFEGRRTIYVKPTHKSAKKLRKVRSAKLAVKML